MKFYDGEGATGVCISPASKVQTMGSADAVFVLGTDSGFRISDLPDSNYVFEIICPL